MIDDLIKRMSIKGGKTIMKSLIKASSLGLVGVLAGSALIAPAAFAAEGNIADVAGNVADGSAVAAADGEYKSSQTYNTIEAGSAFVGAHEYVGTNSLSTATESTDDDYAESENSTGSTDLYIEGDDSKLIVSVPTQVHVKVNGDGSLITPAASATRVGNGSIFVVHVEKIKTTAADAAAGNKKFVFAEAADGAENKLTYTLIPTLGNALTLSQENSSDPDKGNAQLPEGWNVQRQSTMNIQHQGKVTNLTNDIGTDQKFATLDWTFRSGVDEIQGADNQEALAKAAEDQADVVL
jgi:hypothetical protein